MKQRDWEGKRYSYFCNRECEFFPCHNADSDSFNCLFCYCPLYALGECCGGNFSYLPNGVKDCSACVFPHLRENYSAVVERLGNLVEEVKQKV